MKDGTPSSGQSWSDIHTVMSSGKMKKSNVNKHCRQHEQDAERLSAMGKPALLCLRRGASG